MTQSDRASLPTVEEIARWSHEERAAVARSLAVVDARHAPPPPTRRRRLVLAVTAISTVVLVPWIVYLSITLNERHRVTMWGTAWIGFDVLLLVTFALSAWSVWKRRLVAIAFLSATAIMLLIDAWFDVTMSWGTRGERISIATAIVAELPLFVLLALTIRRSLLRLGTTLARARGVSVASRSVLAQHMPTPIGED